MYDGHSDGEAESMRMGETRQAPLGIKVICGIGIFNAVGAIADSGSSDFGTVLFGLGVVLVVLYWGLWKLKSWALPAYVVFSILAIAVFGFLFTLGSVVAGAEAAIQVVLLAYVLSKRHLYDGLRFETVN